MRVLQIAAPVLVFAMIGSSGVAFGARQGQGYGQDQHHDGGYGQGQGGWDAVPDGYQDVKRQGFHDGIQAARQDFQSQQQRPPEAHPEFRHPQVPRESRDDYREGFRRGYSVAMHHMHDGPR